MREASLAYDILLAVWREMLALVDEANSGRDQLANSGTGLVRKVSENAAIISLYIMYSTDFIQVAHYGLPAAELLSLSLL